ncbi:MAG: DUF3043 domain-containing protein [Propionibacteriaceae bacterium]|nr:DUF3043 domain-containing protein [Propionibacteriaceae bacterium]
MGLFKPYKREESAKSDPEPTTKTANKKKTVPTPTRRAAEQARRERLNPALNPKQAKARERELRTEKRTEAMVKVDAEPRRVLLRDYIDARRSISQWAMPIIMVSLAVSMFTANWGQAAMTASMYVTWALFLIIGVDIFLTWRGYKKLFAERLPNETTKGLLSFAINRSINIRRIRMPKPRVKPGDKI